MLRAWEPFPNLQELSIPLYNLTFSYILDMKYMQWENRFRHDTLTTINIHFPPYIDGELSVHLFFRTVIVPALKSLTVICPRNATVEGVSGCGRPYPSGPWDSDALEDMIQRSGCQIEHLELVNIFVYEIDIKKTLQVLPDLTHLTFYELGDNEYLVQSTTRLLACLTEGEQTDAPRLRELGIAFAFPDYTDEEHAEGDKWLAQRVIDMAQARAERKLPKLKMTIRIGRPLLRSTREILAEIDKEGIGELIVLVEP
ncbi:hypothetical protein AAF712_003412 [Marasmius tenuissimus]|uniref:Uncharacterized protein n=1 Tax=Marasmius tenuissimus TaxID=585030 RepID=A0ABR3A7U3_9AGAR